MNLAGTLGLVIGLMVPAAQAQDRGTLTPLRPCRTRKAPRLLPRSCSDASGAVPSAARVIGSSPAAAWPAASRYLDGATWQVMRRSRNRNWGHPHLISFLERIARRRRRSTGGRSPRW